ncbi:MAG: adenylate kinase [bacterium]|nr:adenylate kinase [bacterium]
MRIVFVGPPGAGKGTQTALLIEHLKVPQLATGDMLREVVRDASNPLSDEVAPYMTDGGLVPDELMVAIVGDLLSSPTYDEGCLLDGFPRTRPQAESLDKMLKERGRKIDCVIALSVPEELLTDRLLGRARDADTKRKDDVPGTIPRRLAVYRTQTKPVLEHYREQGIVCEVDGVGEVEEVFQRILHCIENARTESDR